jgi:polyisoprenoid-binding protein YceI
MNIVGVCAMLVQAATTGVSAQTRVGALHEYTVDAGHSIVEFSIPFAFSRVKGRFTDSKGTILYDPANPANSSVTFITQTKSIDTGWPHRDEHLRTSDFFDVEKFPTIEFRSTRMRRSDSAWVAEGTLTMHGVTKSIMIPFHLLRPPVRSSESRWMIINMEGTVRIARGDFGIFGGSQFNSWFDKARASTMGDSVDIGLEVEGYYADAASQRSPTIEGALERLKASGVQAQIARLAEVKKTKTAQEFDAYYTGADLIVRALMAEGRVQDAVALSRAMTELFATRHAAHLVHGFALAVSGDYAGATREYAAGKVIFRAPVQDPNEKFPQDDNHWWYLDQLARTAVEWNRASAAVGLARTIAELYPATARAWTTYGQVLAASGDARGAAAQYAKALQVNPIETRALEWRRRLP